MSDDFHLLCGAMSWADFTAARRRFCDRLALRIDNDRRSATMGLQEFVQAWNDRDAEAIAGQFTPDGVRHQLALPEARLAGRAAIAQGVGIILHAVPDATLEVVSQTVGTDGSVTAEWVFAGTLTNDFPGLPASGQHVRLPGISLYRLDGDGAITEERVYWDSATLMAAAGVLP